MIINIKGSLAFGGLQPVARGGGRGGPDQRGDMTRYSILWCIMV